MVVPAPPGMQPWVRDVDAQLRLLKSRLTALEGATSASRYMAVDSFAPDTIVESDEGISPAWLRVMQSRSPQVSVLSSTGRVRVSVSAVTEAICAVGAQANASAIMRHTFTPPDALIAMYAPDARLRGGLMTNFNYSAGMTGETADCSTYSTVLYLPDGRYSIGSEFLYYHWADNIHIRWSQCSITAEPI